MRNDGDEWSKHGEEEDETKMIEDPTLKTYTV